MIYIGTRMEESRRRGRGTRASEARLKERVRRYSLARQIPPATPLLCIAYGEVNFTIVCFSIRHRRSNIVSCVFPQLFLGTKRPREVGASWARLARPGIAWRLLGSPGVPWAFLAPPGLAWRLLGSPGASWARLAPPGLAWRFLGSSGASWAFLAPPGGRRTHRKVPKQS